MHQSRFLDGIESIFEMTSFVPATFFAHRLKVGVYFDGAIGKGQSPLDPHEAVAFHLIGGCVWGNGSIF